MELLKVILKHAPGCFPGHVILRETWMALDAQYGIMHHDLVSKKIPVVDWASQAADNIRLMCKHVLDLKLSGTAFVSPIISQLFTLVRVNREASSPEQSCSSMLEVIEPPQKKILLQHNSAESQSSSSVQFCSAFCRCPECRDADGMESDTSIAAAETTQSVPAARGAIKQILKRPSQQEKPGAMKIDVTDRHTPGKEESYIRLDGKYLIGLSAKKASTLQRGNS